MSEDRPDQWEREAQQICQVYGVYAHGLYRDIAAALRERDKKIDRAANLAFNREQRIERLLARLGFEGRDPGDDDDAVVEYVDDLHAQVRKLDAQAEELQKLLSPAVIEAATLLKQNADRHPDACCSKCALAFVDRDAARAQVQRVTILLREALPELGPIARRDSRFFECVFCDQVADEPETILHSIACLVHRVHAALAATEEP